MFLQFIVMNLADFSSKYTDSAKNITTVHLLHPPHGHIQNLKHDEISRDRKNYLWFAAPINSISSLFN
jgi:hypothetical protein